MISKALSIDRTNGIGETKLRFLGEISSFQLLRMKILHHNSLGGVI